MTWHGTRSASCFLASVLLLPACQRSDPVSRNEARSASTLRVLSSETTVPQGCRLDLEVPRGGGSARADIFIEWGRCSEFTIAGVTIAQLRAADQLSDLPPDVVRTMTRNAPKGLLELSSQSAGSVIYLDDAGRPQEVMIAD
jgi:hypothetical protein